MDPQSWLGVVDAFFRADPLIAVLAVGAIPIVLSLLIVLLIRMAAPAAPPPRIEEPAAPAPEPVEPQAAAPSVAPVEAPAAPAPAPVEEPVAAPIEEPVAPLPAPVEEPIAAPVEEPVAPPVEEPVAPPAPPPARLRDRLRLTSEALVGRLGSMLSGRSVDGEVLEEIEMLLMSADLGVRTADSLLETVKKEAAGGDADSVRRVLRDVILEKLERVEPASDALALTGKPHVILVLGVNGSGKTTTIGKLAARYTAAGHTVVLGAGDTFRAAASEQLQVWGERVGCEVIAGPDGGDPSAVAFDAVKAATARGADVAIIDTAGRLQTKKPLMEELGKIVRVIGKCLDGAPHETLLVLDANTGQNAISQAQLFTEVAGVTGLVLTKLDGTAKGGVIVGLADEFGVPVKHVGVGEAVEDLRDFSAEEFVEALFE